MFAMYKSKDIDRILTHILQNQHNSANGLKMHVRIKRPNTINNKHQRVMYMKKQNNPCIFVICSLCLIIESSCSAMPLWHCAAISLFVLLIWPMASRLLRTIVSSRSTETPVGKLHSWKLVLLLLERAIKVKVSSSRVYRM